MSRKPDNTRVKLPPIDRKITILCRECMGDRWISAGWPVRAKYTCPSCIDGTQEILAIAKQYGDVEVPDKTVSPAVLRGMV